MDEDRERGLGSHRPSGAGHLGGNAFPGVPPSPGSGFSWAILDGSLREPLRLGLRFVEQGCGKRGWAGSNERQASAGAKARRLISGVCGTRPRGYPGRALSKTDIHRKLLGPGLAAGSLEANWALKFRDLCGDSDSGAAHSQEALASSGLTRSRNSLEGLK